MRCALMPQSRHATKPVVRPAAAQALPADQSVVALVLEALPPAQCDANAAYLAASRSPSASTVRPSGCERCAPRCQSVRRPDARSRERERWRTGWWTWRSAAGERPVGAGFGGGNVRCLQMLVSWRTSVRTAHPKCSRPASVPCLASSRKSASRSVCSTGR